MSSVQFLLFEVTFHGLISPTGNTKSYEYIEDTHSVCCHGEANKLCREYNKGN